jgi:Mg-chelatase subunit ChlD
MIADLPWLSFEYLPAWQVLGLFTLIAAAMVWMGMRSMTGLDSLRRWVSISIRLAVLLAAVLLIGGARWNRPVRDLTVLVLRDVSQSTAAVQTNSQANIQQVIGDLVRDQSHQKPPADRVGMIDFDQESHLEAFPDIQLREGRSAIRTPAPGTDVAQAIRLGLATLPNDTLQRLVLFWDGNATTGDLDAAIRLAAAAHVPIDVAPLQYDLRREVALDGLITPASVNEGEPLTLGVRLRSNNPSDVTVKLTVLINGLPVDLDPAAGAQSSKSLTLHPGPNVVNLPLPALPGGVHRFTAFIEAQPGVSDTLLDNNRSEAVTMVRGKSRILYVRQPAEGLSSPLAGALGRNQLSLDEGRFSPAAFPRNLMDLQQYQAVVLENIPKGLGGLDDQQDKMLAQYVRDLGGGLVMVGGPDAFGAGGWIGSELEKVLPVDCQPPARRMMPAGALVLVIDHSGSMGGSIAGSTRDKQELANESAILALRTLWSQDQVGVVAFDSSPTWVVPLGANDHADATERAIRQVSPAGGTNIAPALREAVAALLKIDPSITVKHVLLLTDGQSEPGDYAAIIDKMTAAGMTLSTVGVGDDADSALLSQLAQMGHGRFYPITDPATLPQVFIKEARTLRNVLIQEKPFVPRVQDADSPLIAGLGSFAPLGGMVMTWPKTSPYLQMPLVNDKGLPVLASWRIGLGQAVAFTSDAAGRWASAWIGSAMFDKFWAQVVRGVIRPQAGTFADARITPTTPGHARIEVEVVGEQGYFQNFLSATATILPPDPRRPTQNIRLSQTGPGSYEGEFESSHPGAYLAAVRLQGTDSSSWVSAAYVVDASTELRDLQSNDAAALQVADRTGGRVLHPFDHPADFFNRAGLAPRKASLWSSCWMSPPAGSTGAPSASNACFMPPGIASSAPSPPQPPPAPTQAWRSSAKSANPPPNNDNPKKPSPQPIPPASTPRSRPLRHRHNLP